MDSSSVQQDVLLENRGSNVASSNSEGLVDCKAKLDLPVEGEITSKLFFWGFFYTIWINV